MVLTIYQQENRQGRWHLPADFSRRPATQQLEILAWVRKTFLAKAGEYGKRISEAKRSPYSIKLMADRG